MFTFSQPVRFADMKLIRPLAEAISTAGGVRFEALDPDLPATLSARVIGEVTGQGRVDGGGLTGHETFDITGLHSKLAKGLPDNREVAARDASGAQLRRA